jgi:hypothetical protein
MKDFKRCQKKLDMHESSSGSNSIGQGSRASSCNSLNAVEGSTVNTNSSKTTAGGYISPGNSSSNQVFYSVTVCTENCIQRDVRFVQWQLWRLLSSQVWCCIFWYYHYFRRSLPSLFSEQNTLEVAGSSETVFTRLHSITYQEEVISCPAHRPSSPGSGSRSIYILPV